MLLSKQFIVAIHVLLLDFLFFIGLLRGTISSSRTLGDPCVTQPLLLLRLPGGRRALAVPA